MRIGFWTSNEQTWPDILQAAIHAEKVGYDTVWFADHLLPFQGPADGPIQECWTVLAGLAASVPRVRLGPLVSGNTYRNPSMLMKMATTVDQISGGRALLGLGAGWQENEHLAYGFDFGTLRSRSDRLEEACRALVSLRDDDRTTLAGDHYQLDDAPLSPAPIGRLPLVVGGKGEVRTLRTTALYADEWNAWADPALLLQKGEVLDRHCAKVGRDPSTIERTAVTMAVLSDKQSVIDEMRQRDFGGRPVMIGSAAEMQEMVGAYVEAGCAELIVPDFTYGPMDRKLDLMEQLMVDVIKPLASR